MGKEEIMIPAGIKPTVDDKIDQYHLLTYLNPARISSDDRMRNARIRDRQLITQEASW